MTVMTEDPSEAIRRIEDQIATDVYLDQNRDRLLSKLVRLGAIEIQYVTLDEER